jgi:hypothetical protein
MLCCFFFIAICSLSSIKSSFTIVKLTSDEEKIYLLNKGWAKEISDPKTVEHLGFSSDNLETITEGMLSLFKLGPTADDPPIYPYDTTLDEITRAEIAKIRVMQEPLLYGMIRFPGEYINPSVIKWKGRLLLATGLAWGLVQGKTSNEVCPCLSVDQCLHRRVHLPFQKQSIAPAAHRVPLGELLLLPLLFHRRVPRDQHQAPPFK